MKISLETKQKIEQFAEEQSKQYLDEAEMTYLEKLRLKTGEAKNKLNKKRIRLRSNSEQGLEAQNDMILYMHDYIEDLLTQGLSEEEAFLKAKQEMAFASGSVHEASLNERFEACYKGSDPSGYEAVGLLYAGFVMLGLVFGGLIGFFAGGGRAGFLAGGWIDTLIGGGVGLLTGVSFGLISNAAVDLIKNKR